MWELEPTPEGGAAESRSCTLASLPEHPENAWMAPKVEVPLCLSASNCPLLKGQP